MVNKYVEENRRDIYKRSIKQGVMKESFDKMLNTFAKPVAKAFKPIMQKIHPDVDFLDPVVIAGLELATLHAIAEIIQASGSIAHKLPGLELEGEEAVEVTDALSRALRGYSGSRMGNSAGEMSVKLFPMVKQLMSDANMAGLFQASEKPKEILSGELMDGPNEK